MDVEVRLYIQGHAFKNEGGEYGFFPVDVTSEWMELFPTYDVSGPSLEVLRVAGSDIINRAVALLQRERAALAVAKAAAVAQADVFQGSGGSDVGSLAPGASGSVASRGASHQTRFPVAASSRRMRAGFMGSRSRTR